MALATLSSLAADRKSLIASQGLDDNVGQGPVEVVDTDQEQTAPLSITVTAIGGPTPAA
jgi:hypothetical protein